MNVFQDVDHLRERRIMKERDVKVAQTWSNLKKRRSRLFCISLSLSLTRNRKHWEGKNSIKFPDQVRNFAVLCQFYYIVIICPFLNAEKQEFTFNFLCYIHIEFMHCEIFSALSQWKWFFIALREKIKFPSNPHNNWFDSRVATCE